MHTVQSIFQKCQRSKYFKTRTLNDGCGQICMLQARAELLISLNLQVEHETTISHPSHPSK